LTLIAILQSQNFTMLTQDDVHPCRGRIATDVG
jgi:hypothetical protein